jgi:di/tripeptidase
LTFKFKQAVEGNNGVGGILGYYIQDLNHIYLTSDFKREIYLVDTAGMVKEKFFRIFEQAQTDEVTVKVKTVGERPCARGVDENAIALLRDECAAVTKEVCGIDSAFSSSSTDCNIPLSPGIPAICVGVYRGAGTHTREEWVEKSSFVPGLEIAIKLAAKMNENE